MNPFSNILRFSVGDLLAKTLNFVAFVHLARVLGVMRFGVLEFATALLMYFLLFSDAGLEAWATRAASQSPGVQAVVERVVPLRLLLASGAFLLLLLVLPLLPRYHVGLPLIVGLYGLTLFTQAVNLRWVYMSQQKMMRAASGALIAQLLFAGAIFLFVSQPERLIWVPVTRVICELVMVGYFWTVYLREGGRLPASFHFKDSMQTLRPAIAMGTSAALEMINYNFDSIVLGFAVGLGTVGWYGAAYRPVNVALAVGASLFLGLFPALARSYSEGTEAFSKLARQTLSLCVVFAVPIGVGGMLLARPLIELLFGVAYQDSIAPLRVLAWSAAVMWLRGCYEYTLNASHHQNLHLRCALVSAALNTVLNVVFIPRFGMMAAAWSTVTAEVVWLFLACYYVQTRVIPLNPLPLLGRPLIAGGAMAATLWYALPRYWIPGAVAGVAVYFGVLWLLREEQVRSWFSGNGFA